MTQINNSYIPQSFINPDNQTLKVDQKLAQDVSQSVEASLKEMKPAEKQIFLDLVASLSPESVDTPEERKATLAQLEKTAANLATMTGGSAFVGSIAELLGRVMIEQASDQREQALKDRLAARESAKADLMSQATKMEEAAKKMGDGAIVGVVLGSIAAGVSVAGSLTSAIGGLKGLKEMNGQVKQMQSATKSLEGVNKKLGDLDMDFKVATDQVGMTSEIKTAYKGANNTLKSEKTAFKSLHEDASSAFNAAHSKAGSVGSVGQMVGAVGDISKSVGGGVDSKMQSEAKGKEAEGQRDAAEAQYQQQIADQKKEIGDQMNEMIKQIINFIKEMQDAEVDAMRAITRA